MVWRLLADMSVIFSLLLLVAEYSTGHF